MAGRHQPSQGRSNYGDFTSRLRNVIVAINYGADPLTFNRLLATKLDIRDELRRLQGLHQQQIGFSEGIVAAWDEFIRDLPTARAEGTWRRTLCVVGSRRHATSIVIGTTRTSSRSWRY
ncbi:hypothetical protein DER45DRAFT_533867 [Fusarium avenaceum]|nr:hypothetical protein DER45DRAFT_533867 [Fusarium avenaceum]